MFLHAIALLNELAWSSRLPAVLPGEPEPEWVRRNAEHARVLAEMRAEKRAARAERSQRGWLARLGLARS